MLIEKVIHLDWCDEDLKATPNGVDIWEQDGHYYFTWESAMREAKAQGVRLPTQREWKQSFEINSQLFNFLKLNYAGYRDWNNGQYYSQGSYGYYWSSTLYPNEYTDYSYFASFYSGSGSVSGDESRKLGFSVRCIKN